MSVSWGVLAPIVALFITVAAMQAAVALTGAIRGRAYGNFENKSADSLVQRFPLSIIDPSTAEERRKSLSPLFEKAHQAANATQRNYYNAVVRSAGCLAFAFLALAFGTVAPEDLPTWLDRSSFELVLSWIDVIAIVFVLILFLHGRIACRPWIAGRTGTELLRQYQILSVVFPSAISAASANDINTQFDIEAGLVATCVQKGSIADIAARIESFWSRRKASIENYVLTEGDLTADALLVYLRRRALRQLGWFTDSKARLEHIAERRNILLASLYCMTAGLAVIKHALFLYSGHSPAYLPPLLLVVTGMSAAITASYINQNSRSLIHRYNSQQRAITGWLLTFNEYWNFAQLPSLTIDIAAKNDIRAQILRFEDLMIEELIDWLHITGRDAIELAP